MPKRPHWFRAQSNAARQGWKTRKARLNTSNLSEFLSRPSHDNIDASPPKNRKQWDENSMICAMEAVKSDELRVNQATKEFGVPTTTLKDQISGCVKYRKNPGPEPYLTTEEESSLTSFLISAYKMGHGKTKRDVLSIVKQICRKGTRTEKWMNLKERDSGKVSWKGTVNCHYAPRSIV